MKILIALVLFTPWVARAGLVLENEPITVQVGDSESAVEDDGWVDEDPGLEERVDARLRERFEIKKGLNLPAGEVFRTPSGGHWAPKTRVTTEEWVE